MKLESLNIEADVPATKLSLEVQMLNMDNGTGQIKFNHSINMSWLEKNFSGFFAVSMVNNESGEKSEPAKFEATKFDSKNDGKVIEFTVSAYNINE